MPHFDAAAGIRWTVRVSPHADHPGKLEVNRTRTDDPSGRGMTMMRLDRNDAMVLGQYLIDVARELPMLDTDNVIVVNEGEDESPPIALQPGDPTPPHPFIDDDWCRFYGPDPGTSAGTTHYENHELCSGGEGRCLYRSGPCPWHPADCNCSFGTCQERIRR
jgi:hypothetical protein